MNRVITLIVSLVLLAPSAVAQPLGEACPQGSVSRIIDRAVVLIERDRALVAVDLLSRVYGCLEEPRLLFYLGSAYRHAGEEESARDYYQAYLDTGDERLTSDARDALTWRPPASPPEPEPVVAVPTPEPEPASNVVEAAPPEEVATAAPAPVAYIPTCDDPPQELARRGAEFFQAGDYDTAIETFSTAFDCQPDPILQYNLGRVYQATDQCGLAREAFQNYVDSADTRVRTEAVEYLNEMASCAVRQNREQAAPETTNVIVF